MSTIQDVSAEQLAKAFHHYREALAHNGGGQGDEEESSESSFWDRASQDERKLMVAAARLALLELATPAAELSTGRKLRQARRGGLGLLKHRSAAPFVRSSISRTLYEFLMNF